MSVNLLIILLIVVVPFLQVLVILIVNLIILINLFIKYISSSVVNKPIPSIDASGTFCTIVVVYSQKRKKIKK